MTALHLVTTAPPTPNGDLHLGHLAGPYSGADVYARACRLRGERSLYATGSDLHQSYVPTKARTLGVAVDDMAQGFADEIASIFASAGFAVDAYVRPQHSARHRAAARAFVHALHQRGRLEVRTDECLYCATCERYLFEAHVTGACPQCGAVSDGNSCEVCAWPNVCTDLTDPRCNGCGATPVLRSYRRLVFPLGRYTEQLARYHRSTVLSPQLQVLCQELTARRLPDIPVSHPTDWGIPVDLPGFEDQRIYVWVEMVPGYFTAVAEALAATGGDADRWRQVWNAADSQIVQFFGYDNGYFHAVLFPALMMAYDESLRLPDALLTNEFYELDSAKFSTSRRHAIWAADLLAHVPADVVRFVLAHDRPQEQRTTFTWDRFRTLAGSELVDRWQPWLADLFTRLEKAPRVEVPAPAQVTPAQRAYLGDLTRLAERGHAAYEAAGFSPRTAARTLCEVVRVGSGFAAAHTRLHASRPGSPEAGQALALECAAARLLAELAYPIMPDFAQRLWHALGCPGHVVRTEVGPFAGGQRTQSGVEFFAPLPDDLEARVMRP